MQLDSKNWKEIGMAALATVGTGALVFVTCGCWSRRQRQRANSVVRSYRTHHPTVECLEMQANSSA